MVVDFLLWSLHFSVAQFPSVLALIGGDAFDVDDMSLAVELVIVLFWLALPFTFPLTANKSPTTAFFEFIDADIAFFLVRCVCARASALGLNVKMCVFFLMIFNFSSFFAKHAFTRHS